MDVILLWTIWATAITSPPDMEALKIMCRSTHPEGRISISSELLSWNDRRYPAAMVICSRPSDSNTPSGKRGTPASAKPSPEKRPV